jgi:hypothetical protein
MAPTFHRRPFKNVFRPKRAHAYNPSAKGPSKKLKDRRQSQPVIERERRREQREQQVKKRWRPRSTCLFMMTLI